MGGAQWRDSIASLRTLKTTINWLTRFGSKCRSVAPADRKSCITSRTCTRQWTVAVVDTRSPFGLCNTHARALVHRACISKSARQIRPATMKKRCNWCSWRRVRLKTNRTYTTWWYCFQCRTCGMILEFSASQIPASLVSKINKLAKAPIDPVDRSHAMRA